MGSFGHAKHFGLGAYGGAALLAKAGYGLLAVACLGVASAWQRALRCCGWFSVRLSGTPMAMLTLAFARRSCGQ